MVLVICGSQVRTMETLQSRQSPLFGRLTGQWDLDPLPFSALHTFLPNWTLEERVAAYAMVGGVPAYLEWLDPGRSLVDNIHHVILAPGSMFTAEPAFLLYDEVREPQDYLAALKAIGAGSHSLDEISGAGRRCNAGQSASAGGRAGDSLNYALFFPARSLSICSLGVTLA